MKIKNQHLWFAGLFGAAVIAATPLSAQADQGKWWEPKQGGGRTETRYRGDNRDNRGNDRGNHNGWYNRNPRFRRDVVVIRDGYRGRSYRAQRVYVRPVYFQRRHLVVVRPVRYFVGADFTIGGVRIGARFHDRDRYVYGCNFCDARFATYGAYERHVHMCPDMPRGYRVDVSDWDDDWNDRAWDNNYQRGYEDGYDRGYDRGDDNGRNEDDEDWDR